MQNAADLGVFYRCEDCACMLRISTLRAQISQNVKYWYEICEVFGTNFSRAAKDWYQFFTV